MYITLLLFAETDAQYASQAIANATGMEFKPRRLGMATGMGVELMKNKNHVTFLGIPL